MNTALKARETVRLGAIRLIIAKLKEADVEARGAGRGQASDDDLLVMMQKMIKQRNDSIEAFDKGGRKDLADIERAEIAVIETYLPQQMNEAEVAAAIKSAVAAVGASSIKDMGKVIAQLKAQFSGRMDFAKASAIVKAALNG
jgi:uncharacterized protein YqeY